MTTKMTIQAVPVTSIGVGCKETAVGMIYCASYEYQCDSSRPECIAGCDIFFMDDSKTKEGIVFMGEAAKKLVIHRRYRQDGKWTDSNAVAGANVEVLAAFIDALRRKGLVPPADKLNVVVEEK